jgi:hypothetical protein
MILYIKGAIRRRVGRVLNNKYIAIYDIFNYI